MTRSVAISFQQFGFQYKSQKVATLSDICIDIYEGEKVAIIGPSGSGKSTLGHCINGLAPNFYMGTITGNVKIFGEERKTIFDCAKYVGTVLQDQDAQFIGLSVEEDIAFILENNQVETQQMHKKVDEISSIVGISDLLKLRPQDLSGGQKQKVSLAGVMVSNVQILLYDEPLANLDPVSGEKAIELIDELHKQNNLTTIIIEHRLEEVLHRPVDRVLLIDEGGLIADLKPKELLCSDLLEKHHIRVPLYISALKYAGVSLDKVAHLEDVSKIDFKPYKKQLDSWVKQYAHTSEKQKTDIPLLEIKGLNFSYDGKKEVLKDISFAINDKELISIVGANGAGKSTLSKLICGFEKPITGDILVKGQSIMNQGIAERAEKIGFVLQNPNAMISQSMIKEEIALGLKLRKVNDDEIEKRMDKILKVCGLYPFRNWPISALSYGQKKRVTIASILILEPDVIIVDEPTAGQDYAHYHEIMEFLKEINQYGVSILFITHDMHLMMEYTSKSFVFSEGELIASGSPSEILANEMIIKQASLKQTSLQRIENACGLPSKELVDALVLYERKHNYESLFD